MTVDLKMLLASAALAWLMLVTPFLLRVYAHRVHGILTSLGNRDEPPPTTRFVDRADRAAKNMMDNLVLFIAVLAAARLGGVHDAQVDTGAQIFFWARVVYFPVYVVGIPYLRTAVWAVGLAGIVLIAAAALAG
jgi:uncharacterized MAPEG superfamily protein